MSTKRKYNLGDDNLQDIHVSNKKHTLDSDEEDSDDYEKDIIGDSDIEGEEDGVSKVRDEIKITPFNMREELEEGHFDTDGHFHWNKSNDIKDNWLDNIDWMKIQKEGPRKESYDLAAVNTMDTFNELLLYKELLSYMEEGETIAGTLRRLDKSRMKLSTVERLKLKKQGILDSNSDKITKLTELANRILTKSGNMDVYQMTYESIVNKFKSIPGTSKGINFDMYSDDFNEKEKKTLHNSSTGESSKENKHEEQKTNEVSWEFKWRENDTVLQGPFNSTQMLKWSNDGYFKKGVYVRKVGDLANFYTSNRMDFELYK